MLDPWIIEEIRRREEEREQDRPQIPLELPLPIPYHDPGEEASPTPSDRGVVIIDN